MELKVVGIDDQLRVPPLDRKEVELNAWKQLALARGIMLDPLTPQGSRSYSIAFSNAQEAIRTLRDLNAG